MTTALLFCIHKNDGPVTTPFPVIATLLPVCKSFGGGYVTDQFWTFSGNHIDGRRMRLFSQLHEREWNAQDHTTHAEQRHGEQWGICSDGEWLRLWHGRIGLLGHGDANDDLRFHVYGDGEYHGRGHYESGHGAGLRALGRRELELRAFQHSVTSGGMGRNWK